MATRRVRMVHSAQRHGLGGVERVATGIAEALEADGWETEWFTAEDVPNYPRSRRYPGLNEAFKAFTMSRLLRRLPGVDLTVSHGTCGGMARGRRLHVHHGTYAGLAAACRAGLPRLDYLVIRYLNGFVERWSATRAARVVVSQLVDVEVSRYYHLHGNTVIHNGVDMRHFQRNGGQEHRARWGLPQDRFLALLVGRMDYGKGREVLREIVSQLPDATHFVIAAPSSAGIEKLPAERVHLIPGVQYDELPKLYSACDVLLCTSLYEGFGLTLAEAWATGLPVVTGRVGVVTELLNQEPTFDACVAEVGDAARLAKSLEVLRAHPNQARRQAAWGHRVTSERFSREQFSASYRHAVEQVMAGGSG